MFQMLAWLPTIVFCILSITSLSFLIVFPMLLVLSIFINIIHHYIFGSELTKSLSIYPKFVALWLLQVVIILSILGIVN
jgi:hypothetical protein